MDRQRGSRALLHGLRADTNGRDQRLALQMEQKGMLRTSHIGDWQWAECSEHMVFAVDRTGTIVSASGARLRQYGVTADEVTGLSIYDVFPREAATHCHQRYLRVFESGEPSTFELSWQTGDAIQTELNTVYPIKDANGKVAWVGVVCYDVANRQQVPKTQARLASAAEQVGEAILVLDVEGTIQYANPAFERLTGYARQELVGQPSTILATVIPENDGYSSLCRAMTQGKAWSGTLKGQTKAGTDFRSECTVYPVQDDQEQSSDFVFLLRDVTHETDLEAQLRQAQKVEAVGRLASGVAHDFNNLLTVIGGYADLLLTRLDSGQPLDTCAVQEMRTDLESISDVVNRAAALTNQLLIFSRKQDPQPRQLNLNDLVRDTEKLLRRLIGEDIALHTSLDPELGWIEADPGHIEQVIVNLAVNARDAMPYGGQLVLETANIDLAPGSAPQDGPHVMLAVSDTGTGMTEEVRTHLFEPFFTTKEPGRGTGLGLATVMGIVEQCAGQIRVESDLGIGTRFMVCFPRMPDTAPPAVEQEVPKTSPRGTETILLVEDERVVRSLARRVLKRQGYTVLTAHAPDECMLISARHDGDIDLLITDVVMPGMGGPELAVWIAQSRPGTQVLYISGYTEDTIAHRGITASDAAFLQKPFTPSALATKVRNLLDGVA